ncbi:pentatricopeptide repeat-containing protein At2g03880, mitochondrial-like [Impatiens glandulifera]|uniref:pentatricopeptide repeat-containing protein At2g03880, mitochondrial-like n=1 Tax=Impatiens glandulifera TaxID=253017 RepID=UPI001FB14B26|nr:pentatricopeptide repeat-containing protein At2g03880, mitochondrial-like [Impatiens glandulifera]
MCIPPIIVRGFLWQLRPSPSTKFLVNAPFLFLRSHSSACSAPLLVEPKQGREDTAFSENENTFNHDLHYGFPTTHRRLNGTLRNYNVFVKERLKQLSKMLQDCGLNSCLRQGKAIHGVIIKNSIQPDMYLWISLINFYAKCRRLNFARQVLDIMPDRDVVSWTVLIAGFVTEGLYVGGISLFCQMRKEGITPNEFTLATVVKACSICLDLDFGTQIHSEIVKTGVFSDVYVGSAVVDLYAKCGHMEYAESSFFNMPEQNVVSWNALLNGYAQTGDGEVIKLFSKMSNPNIKFSNFTLSTVLKGIANSVSLVSGQSVHACSIKTGNALDQFISSALVYMYSKCGMSYDAHKVFLNLDNPDVVTWSAIISCFDQEGRKREAVKLFCSMRNDGIVPNQFTLSSLISSTADLGDLGLCESIHACVNKYGFGSEIAIGNALISMYMRLGSIRCGSRLFDEMRCRDLVSWNSLLSGFQISDQGLVIFKQMIVEGLKPNVCSFIGALKCCSNLQELGFAKQIHALVGKEGLDGDPFVGTALVDSYAKCNRLEEAAMIFNGLNKKDVFSWTVMISAYAQNDQGENSIRLFNQMRKDGFDSNEFTLASCLKGCARITSLESGRQLHSLAIKSGNLNDNFVASSLVDMYGKCGCLLEAANFFKGNDWYDIVMWNTIIHCYSDHGKANESLKIFETIIEEGLVPDSVTFLGILSACSRMGLTEEGEKHFRLMNDVYGISPSEEHNACMIDILGRAGKFDEIEKFIENMKLIPNTLIWETVLAACKIHGKVELGERAANELFELEPEVDSNYILLSNIYASKQRWDDVSYVRMLMNNRGVKKERGCSWVESNGRVHVFLSQDVSHPEIGEIHHKLDKLASQIGYDPETSYSLHNVNDETKRENLLYHSERLAVGLALINKCEYRRTIRIFKNLRICGDCHEFMKLVSDFFLDEEIIIRDVKRFHHFKNGTCSCQDYW